MIRPDKYVLKFNIKPVRTVVLPSPQKQNNVATSLANVTITAEGEIVTSSHSSPETCIILIYMKGIGVD